MNRIKVNAPKDYLIIEKIKGNMIEKGSHLYCGICGATCGTFKTRLKFPFMSDVLLKKLDGLKLKPNHVISLTHETCGESLFLFQKGLSFITLENFNKHQNDLKPTIN